MKNKFIDKYTINGDFGEVRTIQIPIGCQQMDVPFKFRHGGWHRCNDKYRQDRMVGEDEHILLFSLTDGGMLELEGQKPLPLPASTVTWIPPRLSHSYYTQTGQIWELYWLHLAEEPYLHFDQLFASTPFLHIPRMEKITRELEKLLQNRNINGPSFSIESSKAAGNIYHIILQASWAQKDSDYKQDALVNTIIHDMDAACELEWKLSDLSEEHFISVPQLIRRFKNATGMSPHAYLMAIRLQRVSEYLLYSSLSVDEISKKTGFLSTSNMITQFRKYYGMTPGKYRENKL